MKQSRTKGILISYIVLIFKSIFRFILIYFYIKKLGNDGYGFYQYIYSFASYATILDFGVGSVINKFGFGYIEKNDKNGFENILFYSLLITGLAVLIVTVIGLVVFFNVATVYGELSPDSYTLAQSLIIYMIIEFVVIIIQHYYEGIILIKEKYVTLKLFALLQVVIQTISILLLLFSNIGIKSIIIGELCGTLLCFGCELIYTHIFLHSHARYHYRDPLFFKSAFKLSLALCLQSLILYLNTSIDKYVLGRLLSTNEVTIYTLALTFSSFFDEIPTIIQRMYLPQAVRLVENNANGDELTQFVVEPGRYQLALCCGMLGGFLLFGRHFITLWSGVENVDSWWVALFLMVPSLIPLIQNSCLLILTAKNKRMFRSIVLLCMALFNLVLTIVFVKQIGLIGAPLVTCVSLILGNNIVMNVYYKKRIGLKLKRMFLQIFKGIFLCALLASLICLPLVFIEFHGLWWLLIKCLVFLAIYVVLLMTIGFNQQEKKRILGFFKFLVRSKDR